MIGSRRRCLCGCPRRGASQEDGGPFFLATRLSVGHRVACACMRIRQQLGPRRLCALSLAKGARSAFAPRELVWKIDECVRGALNPAGNSALGCSAWAEARLQLSSSHCPAQRLQADCRPALGSARSPGGWGESREVGIRTRSNFEVGRKAGSRNAADWQAFASESPEAGCSGSHRLEIYTMPSGFNNT